MTVHEGGCACGAVRYRVRGEPNHVGICHCINCRQESGSMFVTYADWPIEQFSVSGDFATYDGRSFCPRCGSRLFTIDETKAEIRLGSLDAAPMGLVPTREGWIKRREHWLQPIEGTAQFREDPA